MTLVSLKLSADDSPRIVNHQNTTIQGSCSQIRAQINHLKQFMDKYFLSDTCKPEAVINGTSNTCQFSVKNCFPDSLFKLVGTTFPQDGPNCYGTALFATKNNKTLRYVDQSEFYKIITSQYCNRKKHPQPGYIGVFQAPQHEVIHAYTYIGESLTFEKMGADFKKANQIFNFKIGLKVNTMYKWEVPMACRQYGGSSKSCHNDHYYVNCDLKPFYDNLPKDVLLQLNQLKTLLEKSVQLTNETRELPLLKAQLHFRLDSFRQLLSVQKISNQDLDILLTQVYSLSEQIKALNQ